MKQFISLFRSTTKGDLNVFRIKKGGILVIIILSILMMAAGYVYASMLMNPLHDANLTYIGLSLFSMVIVIINIFEGIYKSQGIIFDAKDNNLLFSLPIKRSYILIVRTLKILIFDYIFEILFLIPCLIKYVELESPDISFYLISLIFLILLPLIPLVISFVIGYLIKAFSNIFKNKKLIQIILSISMFFVVYIISFNIEGLINNIISNATSINEIIRKIYLPIGLYVELVNNFNILNFIYLILLSIIPFILFIMIFQYKYDYIINESKEISTKRINKNININQKSVLKSLVKKEFKTYISIPIYIINTIIGPIIALIFSIVAVVKFDLIIQTFESEFGVSNMNNYLPYLIIIIFMLASSLTTITASSISLEGKKISMLKSLPINVKDIFKSKILISDIIMIAPMLISSIIYIINFKIYDYHMIYILLACFLFPHLISLIGLFVNLKYPKLDFNSEIEVVKQGISVLITMLIGFIISIIPIIIYVLLNNYIGIDLITIVYYIIIIISIIIITKSLNTYGIKKFQELN